MYVKRRDGICVLAEPVVKNYSVMWGVMFLTNDTKVSFISAAMMVWLIQTRIRVRSIDFLVDGVTGGKRSEYNQREMNSVRVICHT